MAGRYSAYIEARNLANKAYIASSSDHRSRDRHFTIV